MEILPFLSIADRYHTLFFDAYGVLKNHQGLIPGIESTFDWLSKNGKEYFILTNDASRGPKELAYVYQKRGLKGITPDHIISSGMLARDFLSLKVKQGTVAYLGTAQSAHYIESIGLKTIPISDLELEHENEISAVVFLDDEGFDWCKDLNKTINLIRNNNIPVVVANTDASYPVAGHQLAVATGGLADMVERIVDKHFIRFGKPDAQMFMFAYEHAIERGGTSDKSKILMIGDTLETDIMGGNKFGLDTVLVLSGNTLPKNAEMRIQSSGILPTFICKSVAE